MISYTTPGIFKKDVFAAPVGEIPTGVPLFIGLYQKSEIEGMREGFSFQSGQTPGVWFLRNNQENQRVFPNEVTKLTHKRELEEHFSWFESKGFLVHAVRGFFENGGRLCFVLVMSFEKPGDLDSAIRESLNYVKTLEQIDLLCAPDLMWLHHRGIIPSDQKLFVAQKLILKHCEDEGDRFAIFDSLGNRKNQTVLTEEVRTQRRALEGSNGALYYPWVQIMGGPLETQSFIPPCGHIAGIYARSDRRIGVHKAPANEVIEGVIDLQVQIDNDIQGELNLDGVNCLRAFSGRGIRVWGARTLNTEESAWIYINVRRLFLTIGRWIYRNLSKLTFESNDLRLWNRIERELNSYLNTLFQKGALKGEKLEEAFYVKCDAELNTESVREQGMVITEIGFAPSVPSEFVIVQIIHGEGGLTITGPTLAV